MVIQKIERLYNQALAIQTQIAKDIDNKKKRLEELSKKLNLMEEVQVFLQQIAKDTQDRLSLQIEDIINSALDAVFPNEYTFKLEFTTSRNRTEAQLLFYNQRTGKEVDPMNASGGGVVDLTAFALRIACYVLENNTDNVIILDEPFRFISRDLQERAGKILKTLSDKLHIQIIMVTHIKELIDCADKVFEVKKNEEGISKIEVQDGINRN